MCIELDLYVVDSRVDRGRDREIIIGSTDNQYIVLINDHGQ